MDKSKIRLYEVDENNSEVFKISIVEEPAVDSMFVYCSEQKRYVNLESDEKRMVYSCALRPNFPIYRNDDSGEYYIKFTPKSVENLSRKFLSNGYQENWSTDHKTDVDGVVLVESWIKTDMEKDKSIALGLDSDLPIGTWFVGAYVENDDVWESIKEGKWGGFSVEAFCDFNEVNNFNKQNTMEINESFWDKMAETIKSVLSLNAVAKNDEELVEDTVELEEENTNEEPTDEPTEEATEVPTEEIVEEVAAIVEESVETEEEQANELQAIVDELQKKVDELTHANEEMKAELEKVQKENQKLSKQPSTNKIEVNASKQNGISAEGKAFLDALYNGNVRY